MTGSYASSFEGPPAGGGGVRSGSDTGGYSIEADALLERMRGVEQAILAEGGAGDLQADRQSLAEAAGDRDGGDAGERHGDCAYVVEVHGEWVGGLLPQPERDCGGGRRDDQIDLVERS